MYEVLEVTASYKVTMCCRYTMFLSGEIIDLNVNVDIDYPTFITCGYAVMEY